MRLRLLVHVAGGAGSGKTTFVEHLVLQGKLHPVIALRAVREPGRREVAEIQDRCGTHVYDEVERRGIDPTADDVPEELRSSAWWRGAILRAH